MKVRMKMVLLNIEEPIKWYIDGPYKERVDAMVASFIDEFIDLVGFQEGGFSKIQSSGYSFFILNETTRDYAEVIYET